MPLTVRPMAWAGEIGERIRRAREDIGLSRSALGDLIEAHEKSVGNYERGEHVPWDKLPKIADALNVDLRWLLHGEAYSDPLQRLAADVAQLRQDVAELLALRQALDRVVAELLVQETAEADEPETRRRLDNEAANGGTTD